MEITQLYIIRYISHYSNEAELTSPTGSHTAQIKHSVLVTALTKDGGYAACACARLINLALL